MDWIDIKSAPESGEFLIGVWEGDWNDYKKYGFHTYVAVKIGRDVWWHKRDIYRTMEGAAYKIIGWKPLYSEAVPWLLIETAPREGTHVLLFGGILNRVVGDEEENTCCRAYYCQRQKSWRAHPVDYYDIEIVNPTHWMPIPHLKTME